VKREDPQVNGEPLDLGERRRRTRLRKASWTCQGAIDTGISEWATHSIEI